MKTPIDDNWAKVDALTELGRRAAQSAENTADDDSEARVSHFESAVECFEQAIQLCRLLSDPDFSGQSRRCEAALYLLLGEVELKRGAWKRGQDAFRQAQKIYRQIDDPAGKARAFEGLALAHLRFGDFELAEMYFRDSIRYFQMVNDESGVAHVQTQRALLALRIQELPEAREAIESAAEYYERHSNAEGIQLTSQLRDLAAEISRDHRTLRI
jgi:tetratricopeptide (TPR) repeat protein